MPEIRLASGRRSTCIATSVVISGCSTEATGRCSGTSHLSTTRVVSRSSLHLRGWIITTLLTLSGSPSVRSATHPHLSLPTPINDPKRAGVFLLTIPLAFLSAIHSIRDRENLSGSRTAATLIIIINFKRPEAASRVSQRRREFGWNFSGLSGVPYCAGLTPSCTHASLSKCFATVVKGTKNRTALV